MWLALPSCNGNEERPLFSLSALTALTFNLAVLLFLFKVEMPLTLKPVMSMCNSNSWRWRQADRSSERFLLHKDVIG